MPQLSKDQILEKVQEQRTPCKVYTRCMGYHRPIEAFNLGKLGEHRERTPYIEKLEKGEQHT